MATKIYIDQGHNPVNPNAGSEGNGFREQDLVYRIGQLTAEALRGFGFDVRLSRPTPETVLGTSNTTSLQTRVNDANAWGADYFISLHTNASVIPSATGSEAFVFRRNTDAEHLFKHRPMEMQLAPFDLILRTAGFQRPQHQHR